MLSRGDPVCARIFRGTSDSRIARLQRSIVIPRTALLHRDRRLPGEASDPAVTPPTMILFDAARSFGAPGFTSTPDRKPNAL